LRSFSVNVDRTLALRRGGPLAVVGFNMLGDALRDLLDPRLKGG